MHHCFLFESKSIQSFVLATNRIKEIIGASEMIESITGQLLESSLHACEADKRIRFSRRAGGAFYAFSDHGDAIDRLAAVWSVALTQYAPGLDYVSATGVGETEMAAFTHAQGRLRIDKNTPKIADPQAGPFVVRSQRTGMPASRRFSDGEVVSESTWRKVFFHDSDQLSRRFAPESRKVHWPLALTPEDYEGGRRGARDFPFVGEQRLLGVIHADGNGLGQVLMNLAKVVESQPERFFEVYSDFSQLIDDVTTSAAQYATEKILEPNRRDEVYPARPVVLAGEDLTIIVRADLAVDFSECFLQHFAKQSARALKRMRKKYKASGLPDRLTACAGIAFVQSSQPYHAAYELAEELCAYAKERSSHAHGEDVGAIPASIAFHRVTTAIIDDFKAILDNELTHNKLRGTLACYTIEPDVNMPQLDHLRALTQFAAADDMARGPARELLALLAHGQGEARRRYQRWREVLYSRKPESLQTFDELLSRFTGGEVPEDLPFGPADATDIRHSPLGDVEMLTHIGGL